MTPPWPDGVATEDFARNDGSYCIVCHRRIPWCGCWLAGVHTESPWTRPYEVWELLQSRYITEATYGWEYN